jgi:hypothetical protein
MSSKNICAELARWVELLGLDPEWLSAAAVGIVFLGFIFLLVRSLNLLLYAALLAGLVGVTAGIAWWSLH